MVLACPACDDANIVRRAGGVNTDEVHTTKKWHCLECKAEFPEPVQRDRTGGGDSRHGLAGRLAAADPDEVPSK